MVAIECERYRYESRALLSSAVRHNARANLRGGQGAALVAVGWSATPAGSAKG